MKNPIYLNICLLAGLLNSGCAQNNSPEIVQKVNNSDFVKKIKKTEPIAALLGTGKIYGDSYVVREADTLFSIAWRSEVDYQELADINNLTQPYTLHTGELIRIRPMPQIVNLKNEPKTTAPKFTAAKPIQHDESIAPGYAVTTPKEVTIAAAADAPRPVYNSPYQSAPDPIAQPLPKAVVEKKLPQPTQQQPSGKNVWHWPVKGPILTNFDTARLQKNGIDIGGTLGTSIEATGAGTVVYSGNGLRGYGNLIIIKHKNNFLSAYAHNSENMVKEREEVVVGQVIARMGNTGAEQVMLHFEIRQNGKPVDPLKFLPPK